MEESKNLLAALEKMLAMKTVGVEPTARLEPRTIYLFSVEAAPCVR